MTGNSFNAHVAAYKKVLASGEIQQTYQRLVGLMQKLRVAFSKKYQESFSVAGMMHGYIDFTYFYLQNAYLKAHKLKLAVVLNHQHAHFELWLLGQTKEVQVRYWQKLKDVAWVDEQTMPAYSIFEVLLWEDPDFDDVPRLTASIHERFESLWGDIFKVLQSHE